MTTPPTVDQFRYPWRRLVPGETHTVRIHWQDGSDLSASTFEVLMLDAYTVELVTGAEYVVDDTDADIGTIVAVATIPADIETRDGYEIRVRQDDETIVAGPVLFAPTVLPVTP
jgi:hypothetical protein